MYRHALIALKWLSVFASVLTFIYVLREAWGDITRLVHNYPHLQKPIQIDAIFRNTTMFVFIPFEFLLFAYFFYRLQHCVVNNQDVP
jgi:hypothetical protein